MKEEEEGEGGGVFSIATLTYSTAQTAADCEQLRAVSRGFTPLHPSTQLVSSSDRPPLPPSLHLFSLFPWTVQYLFEGVTICSHIRRQQVYQGAPRGIDWRRDLQHEFTLFGSFVQRRRRHW